MSWGPSLAWTEKKITSEDHSVPPDKRSRKRDDRGVPENDYPDADFLLTRPTSLELCYWTAPDTSSKFFWDLRTDTFVILQRRGFEMRKYLMGSLLAAAAVLLFSFGILPRITPKLSAASHGLRPPCPT